MTNVYAYTNYTVRRKVFKIFGGGFHIYDPNQQLVAYSKMKAFKFKEDIRLYTDESMQRELLVIQARQRIQTDEEVQTFILSGICRAEDVTPDNTILSSQMFDKSLTKNHQGAVRETTRRGWLSKLLDVISPF